MIISHYERYLTHSYPISFVFPHVPTTDCLRNCALPGTLQIAQAERILTCLPQNLRNSSAFTAADMINQLCIATEFDLPTHRTYFMRLCRGIALEFLEEVTSARDRICSAPCERLVRSQVCVVDSKLRRGKKATELVVEPGHQLGEVCVRVLRPKHVEDATRCGVAKELWAHQVAGKVIADVVRVQH